MQPYRSSRVLLLFAAAPDTSPRTLTFAYVQLRCAQVSRRTCMQMGSQLIQGRNNAMIPFVYRGHPGRSQQIRHRILDTLDRNFLLPIPLLTTRRFVSGSPARLGARAGLVFVPRTPRLDSVQLEQGGKGGTARDRSSVGKITPLQLSTRGHTQTHRHVTHVHTCRGTGNCWCTIHRVYMLSRVNLASLIPRTERHTRLFLND